MASVTVTETPQDLAALLGLRSVAREVPYVLWGGMAQNTSTSRNVYRLRSETQPARDAPAFRHRPGETFRLTVLSDPERTWLWTAGGSADLVMESD